MTFERALSFVVQALYVQRRYYTTLDKLAAINKLLEAISEYNTIMEEA